MEEKLTKSLKEIPRIYKWIDRGSYLLHTAEQGTEEWKLARRRITASKFGYIPKSFPDSLSEVSTLLGSSSLSEPLLSVPLQTSNLEIELLMPPNHSKNFAHEIMSPTPIQFTEKEKERIEHGVETEPIARDWYEKEYGVKVEQVGLAVPKWDYRIGGSPDGLVGENGMIEIKCPVSMYQGLIDKIDFASLETRNRDSEFRVPPSHIWTSHYDQMQGCMAILGRDCCDYVVYSTGDESVYTERIPFNKDYWWKTLYPRIAAFLDKYKDIFGDIEAPVTE